MKLLHKQLLVVCLPFLVLIAGVLSVNAWVIEPMEAMRFHREAKHELEVHAKSMRFILDRAEAQLKLIAELPAFSDGVGEGITQELQRLNPKTRGLFEGIYFRDLQNMLHDSKGTVFPLQVPPYEREQLTAGNVVITDARKSRASSLPVFLMIVPVRDKSGHAVGSVAGEVLVQELIPEFGSGATSDARLLTLRVNQSQMLSRLNTMNISNSPNLGSPFPASADPRSGRWVKWDAEAVQIMPENWSLAISIPLRDLHAASRRCRNAGLGSSILGLIVACGSVVWWQHSLRKRFDSLREVIQRFGASDQTIRSDDQTSDELGRVAEAFNCMADDVSHAQRKLQKQLAEYQQSPGLGKKQIAELEGRVADWERYAAQLAHEFNGPLATLAGFTTSLSASAKEQAWDRFDADVARVQTISRQLRDVVDVLLKLAKRETNQPFAETVSLQRAATEAVELLPLSAALENLEMAADLPTVPGDPVLWRHLFLNLLQNALKACAESKSPRIEIGWERRNADVVCYIRDHGRGISPVDLERIFQGPDFGLRLVRQIVELHGGKVWAESNGPGTGMTVWWTVIGS